MYGITQPEQQIINFFKRHFRRKRSLTHHQLTIAGRKEQVEISVSIYYNWHDGYNLLCSSIKVENGEFGLNIRPVLTLVILPYSSVRWLHSFSQNLPYYVVDYCKCDVYTGVRQPAAGFFIVLVCMLPSAEIYPENIFWNYIRKHVLGYMHTYWKHHCQWNVRYCPIILKLNVV